MHEAWSIALVLGPFKNFSTILVLTSCPRLTFGPFEGIYIYIADIQSNITMVKWYKPDVTTGPY
jgi:hypothetical protein